MENGNGEISNINDKARLAIMDLAHMMSVPMSLNAVVKLKLADAIWQGGSNAPLTSAEILAKIRGPKGGGDAENLQRVLRLLTSYDVFEEHTTDDGFQRRYSLTEVGKTLVTDENGLSHGSYVLQHHQDAILRTWPMVHEVINDSSSEPFLKANGEKPYNYYGNNPELNSLMLNAMSGVSVPFMKGMLERYDGFQEVKTLVDVGGSGGDCLKMILEKHSSIQLGINFDLPEVVKKAPQIPRIKHVGGDIFDYIPKGDVIFMKWMLPIWTDDECKQIMKNCYDALPKKGKLIACEPVVPNHTDDSQRTRALLGGDIFIMSIYRAKGKHRTEEEFRQLGQAVGFSDCRTFYGDHYFTILEFHKL
ncbi:nicotinate N-methyltransferase 1 [Capsicum galapagoense]